MKDISNHIFRAYDIRGLYGKDIDPTIFYRIGLAAGTYVKQHMQGSRITVGNDIRKSSYPLVHAFLAGVNATGIHATYTGTTSFGQTLFSGWQKQDDLIAFVTASHLPPEWNGIKFYYGDGVGFPEEKLIEIRDIALQKQWNFVSWSGVGETTTTQTALSYQEYFQSKFSYQHTPKIALDCGGASMTLSAPEVFTSLGIDVVPVFCDPDPSFSQRPSDPKPANLTKVMQAVTANNCDFGVAFDGDGDRSVLIDNTGSVLSSDETGIILAKYGFPDQKGVIITNVECSKAVSEQLTPLGFTVKQIQVGHTFLTLHAKKEHALLGMESSGHFILPSYFLFDDAIVVPLKIAEILDRMQTSLETLKNQIPTYPLEKTEIPCDDELKFTVIKQLQEQLKTEFDDINTLDGIRISLEHGWVLIRASNTSPIIRLTTEANTPEDVTKITNDFKEKTEAMIDECKKHHIMQIS